MINDLNLHGKHYTKKEINKKFLLTLPAHLEHRITAIRESRDMNEVSLERLYSVLKTYELEQIQQKEIYGNGKVVSMNTALVANQPEKKDVKVDITLSNATEYIEVEVNDTPYGSHVDGDFYTLEELDQLEDQSMASVMRQFSNMRFRRDPRHKVAYII